MTVTVRFAPSPTGRLHVGNARIALVNWLFARKAGGRFILRIDDTDFERSKPEHEAAIETDLCWLGLEWAQKASQSARSAIYDDAAERLKQSGRLYPSYETPDELAYKRKRQLARGAPPVYDRAALALTYDDRARLEAEGRRPHWRFKLEHRIVAWDDLVRGPCHYHAAHLSDPVLLRADGTPLYTLPSVVDDAEMAVSHVIRGEDHVTNTAAQIQLFEALGATPPLFAHLPLLVGGDGQGLSKRLGSLSLGDLREDGVEAMAINSLLARLGSSEAIGPAASLEDLLAGFDIGHFGRATPRFDPAELWHLNARLLQSLPYASVGPRLAALGIEAGEEFWLAVRGNLQRLSDAAGWWQICHARVTPVIEDGDLLRQALTLLPDEPWNAETWRAWTKALQAQSDRQGRALFHPLRLALTGRGDGPELKSLLPLIGRDRVRARLQGETA
jgi:glutamyl-tRNA synthetase